MPIASAKLHITERERLEDYAAEIGGAAGPANLTLAFTYMLHNLDIHKAIADAAEAQTSGDWVRLSVNLTGEQHERLEAVQAALTEDRRSHLGFEDAVSMNQTIRFVIRNAPPVSGVA